MSRFRHFAAVFISAAGFLIAPFANAQLTTFAQFLQSGNLFTYGSTGSAGAGGEASLGSANAPLLFFYSNIVGLPTDLSGVQSAHITFTSLSTLGRP